MPIADPAEPTGLRVFKRGNATCLTEGVLDGIRDSAQVSNEVCSGIFNRCFVVSDLENSSPFFKRGDSGSGVFVLDNTSEGLKALGIAFASHMVNMETLVCKLSDISREFNLSISQEMFAKKIEREESEMETS